jgi:hypothetical protein
MNKATLYTWLYRLAAGLAALGLVAGLTIPVQARTSIPATSILLLDVGPQPLMQDFTVMALVTDSKGTLLPNLPVVISAVSAPISSAPELPANASADTVVLGRADTNDQGMAIVSVSRDLQAGKYLLKAEYRGSRSYEGSSASGILTILPSHITIQTVPPLEGVAFRLDEQEAVTNSEGKVTFNAPAVGSYQLKVVNEEISTPGRRIVFSRWLEEVYEPELEVRVPGNETVQVGFDVYQRASFAFLDLDGKTVDPARTNSTTLKNIQGETFTFTGTGPNWLPAGRVARRMGGLEATNLLYSVMRVEVDGSNVVNQAQQRFYVNPDDLWNISLLLYHLDIGAKDAIFGTPVGKLVTIEFPNGQSQDFPLNAQGMVSIPSLARGIYYMQVKGVTGISSRTPVALSQNQQAEMKVITALDIALVIVGGALLALGLLFFGRPWLIPGLGAKLHHGAHNEQLEQGMVTIHEN